jgi:imidazolonepropionase-like amidohydrolase
MQGMAGAGFAVRLCMAIAAVVFGSAPVIAQTSYVHAGHLLDVEAGVVRHDQIVRIVDGKVASVGAWRGAPSDGPVVDWSTQWVLPGLIDMHTHLAGDIQGSGVADPLISSEADDALAGAANASRTLRAGFTTVRDVGSWRAFTDVALRNAINRGLIEGPRMAVVGAYLTAPGGGGTITGLADDVGIPPSMTRGVVKDEDDMRDKARYLLRHKVDWLKLIATGAVLTVGTEPGQPELTEAEMRVAVEEAKKYGVRVTAHAHGAEGAKMAIRAGVASIEHGSLLDAEALDMMKKAGVYLVADIYNGDYIEEVGTRDGWPEETLRKNRETTDTQREVFRLAVKKGVKIAYGTDAGVYPNGLNARQFRNMVKYGLSPMQAIQSATLWAADLLGWPKQVGAISAGHWADMAAVGADPIADISVLENISHVMKGGVVVR